MMADEQIGFEDEEYGGSQKMQYQGSGAIHALEDEEIGEDEEYDDLYNDVNIGENFQQMHQSDVLPPPSTVGDGGYQAQNFNQSTVETGGSKGPSIPGGTVEGKISNVETNFSEPKEVPMGVKGSEDGHVGYPNGSSTAQKGRVVEMTHDSNAQTIGFRGTSSMPSNVGVDPSMSRKAVDEPSSVPNTGATGPQFSGNRTSINMDANRSMMNEIQIQPPVENGPTVVFVGELHWWTTDADLESVLSQYGKVKEIKFFEERASGKSKGYCQVEFYDAPAAAACKEGMNGHVFNGRPCIVAFASPQTMKQMAASHTSKTQGQPQTQNQGKRPMNDGLGRGDNMNFQGGDPGRNFGRGGWGRGGQGMINRGPGGGGLVRGRGGAMGAKNMFGAAGGVGIGANGGGYGQGMAGPAFGGPAAGMMPPQNMMGPGFDPAYMGRGGGYGGFGPGFPGMLPSFPGVNAMGHAGVAPHVNPAFFGRGMAPNGIGMMGPSGMDGPNAGMWADTGMGDFGEEPGRRTRESSYGGDDGGSEYSHREVNNEKVVRSSVASRENERVSERDLPGNSDRRHRDEREQNRDKFEREHRQHRYREEKDSYREHRRREHDSGYEDDRDRGHSSSKYRSRSRAVPEENYRSRSREADYGKRRRLPSE